MRAHDDVDAADGGRPVASTRSESGTVGEPTDGVFEASILALLNARAVGGTICPSEVARAVAAASASDVQASDAGWRDLMEPARAAARRLVASGDVEITQGGQVVPDPCHTQGPIRIRRRRPGG